MPIESLGELTVTKHETPKPSQASPGEIKETPSGYRPWEDRSLPPEERFEAYKAHVQEQVLALGRAAEKLGTMEELWEFTESPETQRLFAHAEELSEMKVAEYFIFMWKEGVRQLLGKNFLGAEEWRAQDIDVGAIPTFPGSITQELLESDCPLHPGEKIKDTHVLVLIPKTVNGEPYSALKLDELCATRKGSGDKLIYDVEQHGETEWKEKAWARAQQAQSEWVLIPKSDPDPERMREKYGNWEGAKRHFRCRRIDQQLSVNNDYYKEYRPAKTLEVMTMALLYDLTHKERLLPPHGLRCKEQNGPVVVGSFTAGGLKVWDVLYDYPSKEKGLALARKL